MKNEEVLARQVPTVDIKVGDFVWLSSTIAPEDRFLEVVAISPPVLDRDSCRILTADDGGSPAEYRVKLDSWMFVRAVVPVTTPTNIVELPRTGHVFVRDSVKAFTPLECYDWSGHCAFTVVGVGFLVRIDCSIEGGQRLSLQRSEFPSHESYTEACTNHLRKEATAWYDECKALVFGSAS